MDSCIVLCLILNLILSSDSLESRRRYDEPQCYSKFDYDFKVAQTLADLTTKQTELQATIKKQQATLDNMEKIVGGLETRKVAFYVQRSTDLNGIPNHQTIVFDTVTTNIGNRYNRHSGMFTCVTPGVYVFHWVNTNKDRSYMNTELVVNGQVRGKAMSDAMDHSDYAAAANAAVVELTAGDQVWIRSGTWHNGHLTGSYYSTFSGWLL